MDLFKKLATHFIWTISNERGELGEGEGGGQGVEGEGLGSGDTQTSWLDSLPDEVKSTIPEEYATNNEITRYSDLPTFMKSHVNLSKKIGEKGILPLKEGASEDEVNAYYNALGRPETADGYKLDAIEGLHESIQITDESTKNFFNVAHSMGLTNAQANSLNKWYLESLTATLKAQEAADQQAAQEAETALRKEWGDKFQANSDKAAKLIISAGGQEALDAMGGAEGLGNNPAVLKALSNIAGMIGEDQIGKISSGSPNMGDYTNKQSARQKLDEYNTAIAINDRSNPLVNENHPDHQTAVEERTKLFNIVYKEEDA